MNEEVVKRLGEHALKNLLKKIDECQLVLSLVTEELIKVKRQLKEK